MAKKQTESGGESLEAALAAENARVLSVKDKEPESPEIAPSTLAALEGMTRGELVAFIKCLPSRITGYALQTKDEKREAMKLRVYEIAMGSADNPSTLKACNDWLDREDGKATVMVQQHVTQESTLTVLMQRALGELRDASAEDVLAIKGILENGSVNQS